MTDWTTQKTWSSEVLTATGLNTYLRDNTNHLHENSIPILIPGMMGSPDVAGRSGAGTSEEWGTTTPGLTWNSNPTTVDSHTTVPDHIYINEQADTTVRLGQKAWTPAGAFDARLGGVRIGANTSVAGVSGWFGMVIANSDNTLRLQVDLAYAFDTIASIVRARTYASATYTVRGSATTVPSGLPIYLRITRDASNNASFYWSMNGMLWNFIATQALTLTVATIGLYVQGNNTAGYQCVADWMRTDV